MNKAIVTGDGLNEFGGIRCTFDRQRRELQTGDPALSPGVTLGYLLIRQAQPHHLI